MVGHQISLCMIVKNEQAGIERCLRSARPHVDEIIVVDTGSTDATVAVAAGFADRVVRMADCNNPQTGLIEDFAQARNYAFDLATKPWVFWMDGDDELVGGEHLRTLAGFAHAHKAARWQIPYEYTHDANGNCTCIQERERLVSPRSMFRWVHPIHETLNAVDPGVTLAGRSRNLVGDQLRVVHRHDPGKSREPGRNLRILEAWYAKHGEADARILFYLGRELSYTPQFDRAVEILSRYIELSGWDEEKCLAAIRLAEMFQSRAKPDQADFMPTVLRSIDWGARAMALRPDWGEAYFCLARSYFLLAEKTALQGDYLKVAEIASMGLDKTPTETKTALFVNPRDRLVEIHRILNIAYNKIGRTDAALRSVVEALEHEPNDESLNRNKRVYEQFMARGRVIGGLAELQNHGMAPTTFARVMAMVDGPQPEPASIEWGDIALAKRRFPEVGADAPAMPSAAAATDWPPYHRPATWPKVGVHDFRHARVSPHAQAWAVPEQVVLDDLPIDTTAGQVLALTIQLWKEYLLHDEVIAAERLLADAPYRIKHNASVQRALAMTRGTFAWMHDHDAEQRINAPADPTVETGVPLPGELSGQLLGRMQIAKARIRPGERVFDFGCSDGSIANRLALTGIEIVGLDLCKTSIALAQRKAEEFKTGAKFVCVKFSELVDSYFVELKPEAHVGISTDTYEHVVDPVSDLLLPAKTQLRPDGRFVMCTPYGAWMRGQFVSWAHPWRWADERGLAWNAPIERAHLVAPTPWTVAANLRKAGFYVYDSYVELCETQDVPEQGNVVAEAHVQAPKCADSSGPLDIVIAGPAYSYESWTPRNLQRGGIGGSETAVIEVAKRLAARGHRVRVYATPGEHGAGVYAGVEYRQTGRMAQLNGVVDQAAMTEELDLVDSCDLLIAWRYADMLDHVPGAKRRWLWVHDVYAHAGTPERLAKADRILALSQWHRDFMAQHYGVDASRFTVTRNGIDLSRFVDKSIERDQFKVVNSSSPDRSWQALLQLWPQVRAVVPDATLHLFYGFDNWEKTTNPDELAAIAQLKARITELAGQGVVLRGRVDQQTLAREFLSAGVFAYPTWFSETSCIGAMEAQAAGLRVVTSAIAALNETAQTGILLQGDWLSSDYQQRFVAALVDALRRPDTGDRAYAHALARATFGWDGVAEHWVQMARADLSSEPSLQPYADALRADANRIEYAREQATATGRRFKLAFIYGPFSTGSRHFDFENLWTDSRGLTGSEVSCFMYAAQMARRGHDVTLFVAQPVAPGAVLGAERIPVRSWSEAALGLHTLGRVFPDAPVYDAVLSWNEPDLLRRAPAGALRICNQQLNDFTYCQPSYDNFVDVYTAPGTSQKHFDFVRNQTPSPHKWTMLPNGCDPAVYAAGRKVPGRVLWASSADRGLHLLLQVWPEIRRRVPHATLRALYNFSQYGELKNYREGDISPWTKQPVCADILEIASRVRYIEAAMAQLKDYGVEHVGSVSRLQMVEEWEQAEVLGYSCDTIRWSEGFSVTTMEACASGAVPVVTDIDALGDIYGGLDSCVKGWDASPAALQRFTDNVVRGLTDPEWAARVREQARALAEEHRWDKLALRLEGLLVERVRRSA